MRSSSNRLLAGLAPALLALAGAGFTGCNTAMEGSTGTPIQGETWVDADGAAGAPTYEGSWHVVEFFKPT